MWDDQMRSHWGSDGIIESDGVAAHSPFVAANSGRQPKHAMSKGKAAGQQGKQHHPPAQCLLSGGSGNEAKLRLTI